MKNSLLKTCINRGNRKYFQKKNSQGIFWLYPVHTSDTIIC